MGCFEDYLEFKECIEALRAEAKTRKYRKMKHESLSEERLKDAENQN